MDAGLAHCYYAGYLYTVPERITYGARLKPLYLRPKLISGKDLEAEHGCRAGCGERLRGTHGPGE